MWGRGAVRMKCRDRVKRSRLKFLWEPMPGSQRPCAEMDWDLTRGLKHSLFLLFTKVKDSICTELNQRNRFLGTCHIHKVRVVFLI